MEKQPDSPTQHNFAKQKWQPIYLIIALKHPAWLISLFLSLYSFFLVFNKINSAEPFPFSAQTITFLAILHVSLFYLMFLRGWGLQHLASCPISVRSGGWFWVGGISGVVAPFLEERRCNCISPFQNVFSLHYSWNIHRFSLSCTTIFYLFAFLWLSNRTPRISKITELLCIRNQIKIWAWQEIRWG